MTPSPIESSTAAHAFATHIKGWGELKATGAEGHDAWSIRNLERLVELEADAPRLVSGRTLLNFDVRADNILISGDGVFFVDWRARVGAAFVDCVGFAPSAHTQGGPNPDELLRRAELGDVSDDAISATRERLGWS